MPRAPAFLWRNRDVRPGGPRSALPNTLDIGGAIQSGERRKDGKSVADPLSEARGCSNAARVLPSYRRICPDLHIDPNSPLGMPPAVKQNITSHPAHIIVLRSQGVVARVRIPAPVQQFWLGSAFLLRQASARAWLRFFLMLPATEIAKTLCIILLFATTRRAKLLQCLPLCRRDLHLLARVAGATKALRRSSDTPALPHLLLNTRNI